MAFRLHLKKTNSQEGQALVIVLLVIVIAVVIAVAITYRTIQDIRRTGEERASDSAGSQVESFLDVLTSPSVFDQILSDECDQLEPNEICTLNGSQLAARLGGQPDWPCDDGSNSPQVQLRLDSNVNQYTIAKDDVFELNLEGETVRGFCLTYTSAPHVMVKLYRQNPDFGVVGAFAFGSSDQWGNLTPNGPCGGGNNITWAAGETPVIARIKAIGGDATITVTNLEAPQTASMKSSCYIGEVYREFVRVIQLHPSLPAAFDYVLFDKTGAVTKN